MREPTKTPDEIRAEIGRLTEMKPRVRHFTLFGDDNHKAIEAQCFVLEFLLTNQDTRAAYDQLYKRYPGENESGAGGDAIAWVTGEFSGGESLSGDWSELVT